MRAPVTLETDRLFLRPWKETDYEPYYRMIRDPEVMQYLPPLADEAESNAQVSAMRHCMETTGWGFWVVERKNDAEFLGAVGLKPLSPEWGIGTGVEIGWRLARPYWGKGYALEAAWEALRFGFVDLHLPVIVAYVGLNNERSQGLMHRLGMERTTVEFDLPGMPEGHPHGRHVLYRITREAWLKV